MVAGEWLAQGDKTVMCMESSNNLLGASSVEGDASHPGEHSDEAPTPKKRGGNVVKNAANDNKSKNDPNITVNKADGGGNEPINILIEIVGATLPNRLISGGVKWEDSRGMYCAVHWVGPPNPSGRKRREVFLHRTKSLKVKKRSKSAKKNVVRTESSELDDEANEDEHHAEYIFTVNEKSLFLFMTTMKQLVNASSNTSSLIYPASSQPPSTNDSEEGNAFLWKNGGLRFDVFLKPLDALSKVSSRIAASNKCKKEENAITQSESSFSSSMIASYRLMGSIFLTPADILNRCNEERFEVDLNDELRQIQQHPQLQIGSNYGQPERITKPDNGGKLALRMRLASESDMAFLKLHSDPHVCNDAVKNHSTLQSSLSGQGNCYTTALKHVPLLTEIDKSLLTAKSSIRAISVMAPVAHESLRYLTSDDKVPRVLVKPYPDPARLRQTRFLTEAELREECFKPSTNWTKAGSGSLWKVYLEVLQCQGQGLPNVDTGGSLGNKTDSFVSIVYGDVMVQTDCIDDILSPMWLPWTQRAFVLDMSHPSTALYIAVTDYDVGPLEHENIGRVAINIGTRFTPGLVYTLTYRLNESSSLSEFGKDNIGTITLRLRVEYDEKMHLTMGKSPPTRQWLNSTQYKTHRVAKYACDGPHDNETFEMRLLTSHVNEIMTQKQTLIYLILQDSIYSLIFWKPQVKVGGVWLPLHSAVAFYFSVHVVENPRLLPSMMFFLCGWIMIVSMMHRQNHPNPWHRGHSFLYYWNVLVYGKSFAVPKPIPSFKHHTDTLRYEKFYTDRLEEDNAQYEKQVELSQKLLEISNDANICTKVKANSPLVDPISAVVGTRLLPYQQRLSEICGTLRYYRNILNWNESVVSFWITMIFFGLALLSLLIPWGFVLRWSSRLVVWVVSIDVNFVFILQLMFSD